MSVPVRRTCTVTVAVVTDAGVTAASAATLVLMAVTTPSQDTTADTTSSSKAHTAWRFSA